VLIAIALVACVLSALNIDYARYFQGALSIHILLGPAVVALAVPLFAQAGQIRAMIWPLLGALICGCTAGIVSAVGLALAVGLDRMLALTLAPKSATAAIAMGTVEQLGGVPALCAALVILTGITGAISAPALARWIGVRDQRIAGFAAGLAGHGIATARMIQIGEQAGAFAGLAMGLNGVLTAFLAPLIVPWLLP
jgi:putative effector of murein hydrolase